VAMVLDLERVSAVRISYQKCASKLAEGLAEKLLSILIRGTFMPQAKESMERNRIIT